MNFIYKVELLSDSIPGAGHVASPLVDKEVTADDLGLPILQGRRIKGLLLESVLEFREACETADLAIDIDNDIEKLFGRVGVPDSNSIRVSDAEMKFSTNLSDWIEWVRAKDGGRYAGYFPKERVLDSFSYTRSMTALENGVAKEHSLRTFRVLKKGLVFSGRISLAEDNPREFDLLTIAANNLRHLGASRNRGFGKIRFILADDNGVEQNPAEAFKRLRNEVVE